MGDFEEKIRIEFIQETRELLLESESLYLQLENDPDNAEIMDRIFRMVHTIKGSGFTVGFEALARFAHQFENMLALVRAHTLAVNASTVSLMLRSNDVLKEWVELLTHDFDAFLETAAIAQEMTEICAPYAKDTLALPATPMPAFGFFEDEPVSSESRYRPSILVVDDDVDVADVLIDFLESTGAIFYRAEDGLQALESLKKNTVDLIITDIRMPNMDGLAFINKLSESDCKIPVIFISGAADRRDVVNALNLGAYAFLEKPISLELVQVQVRNALQEKWTRDTVIRLSQLNFKAYMAASQLGKSRDEKKRLQLEVRLREILDEITLLQNEILKPKLIQLAA